MAQAFDPYLQWLGIRDPERPPNHYRLLGVELFENDPNVLMHAADRQMAHVRTFQTGPNSTHSQRLLNELAAAKLCLLNPQRKTQYDATLRAQLAAAPTTSSAPELPGPQLPPPVPGAVSPSAAAFTPSPATPLQNLDWSVSPPSPRPRARRSSKISSFLSGLATLLMAIVLLLVCTWAYLAFQNGSWNLSLPTVEVAKNPWPKPQPKTAPAETIKPNISQPARSTMTAETPSPGPSTAKGPDSPVPLSKDAAKRPLPADDSTTIPGFEVSDPDDSQPDDQSQLDIPQTDVPTKSSRPSAAEPAQHARLPIPPTADQQKSLEQIRDLFKTEYAHAQKPDTKRALGAMLRQKAEETKDDPTARYVLFAESRNQALDAGDSDTFLQSVKSLGTEYEVDWLLMARTALHKAASKSREPAANAALAATALDLTKEAVARDDYEAAVTLIETARDLARRSRQKPLLDQAVSMLRDVKLWQLQYKTFLQASEALAQQPDNPEANLAAGKYYCFVKDDFDRGLPCLLKGSDQPLRALAQAELAPPEQPADMVALADRWWDFAANADPVSTAACRKRAAYWYQKALTGLSGLTRTRAERRIEESRPKSE